jgi:reactive intermediate/imine deaminase
MREAVTTPDVHVFDAPYSGALREGGVLFVAGTVAVDEHGALVGEGDLVAQTRQVLLNIQRLLAAAGAGYEHVTRMTYYVTDISRWADTAAVRREFLREPYPAATAVEVSRLVRPEWLIEIEAVAILPG